MTKRPGSAGLELEELLRAYFLRAGFFVARGVPLAYNGEDLTDVDLLLYERPTGATRRIEIVDIKYKQKPRAVERLLWTRGLVDALDVDGAYVATTDSRSVLRNIAEKLGLSIIDGADLHRMREQKNLLFAERLSDEELVELLASTDAQRKDRQLTETRRTILGTLAEGFGPSSVVSALSAFSRTANSAVLAFPGSSGAEAAVRLAYLAAAIACAGLDYISVEAAFRSLDERRELLLNAVRYGAAGSQEGKKALMLAVRLVESYAPGGGSVARKVERNFHAALDLIPAEIVADQASRLLKDGALFNVARELEFAAYQRHCPAFDDLNSTSKSMVGAFLDYAGVNREKFASAWLTLTECAADLQSTESAVSDGASEGKPELRSEEQQSSLFE